MREYFGQPTLGDKKGAAPPAEGPQRQDDTGGEKALAGIRVLVVDDEADIREAFQVTLEHYGAEVTTASSVADALVALERSTTDVLLSDIAMPGASGYDLMHQIRGREGSPPAAAVTAHAGHADLERALAAGFQMHLAKPLGVSALVSAVAELAGRPLPKAWGTAPTRAGPERASGPGRA